jgi:hypothetical protein
MLLIKSPSILCGCIVPHKIFSQDRLQNYLAGKELGFGRQVLQSEDYSVYNTIIELVIHELVSDGTIIKQQKESTPDDLDERYEAKQNLDRILRTLGIVAYYIRIVEYLWW